MNVRVIAATHRALGQLVDEGQFRADLFYRLVVVQVNIAPLRERPEDLPLLVRHFAEQAGTDQVPDAVVERWKERTWPGNVRELRNTVRSYLALGGVESPSQPAPARPTDLREALQRFIRVERPYNELKEDLLERFMQVYFDLLLQQTGGNQSEASRLSGIERAHLNRVLKRLRDK